ncbi:hypothetical protein MSAS_27790 [Mycobacterium saskatchewanense]|nr:hypothetical protein MSAS_27790 [Mycobacterium saskatchewanense]
MLRAVPVIDEHNPWLSGREVSMDTVARQYEPLVAFAATYLVTSIWQSSAVVNRFDDETLT